MPRTTTVFLTLAAFLGLIAAQAAWAGLGEPMERVAADHAALGGQGLLVTPTRRYDIREITGVDGTRIREFTQGAGPVFAVAFSGRSIPDLKVLLGARYAAYLAETAKPRSNHHSLAIDTPELVLRIVMLPRGFVGTAHVPALVPNGVPPTDLR